MDGNRLHFASAEEILTVTDCIKGAVAPLGLNTKNLIRVAGAKIASIAEER